MVIGWWSVDCLLYDRSRGTHEDQQLVLLHRQTESVCKLLGVTLGRLGCECDVLVPVLVLSIHEA